MAMSGEPEGGRRRLRFFRVALKSGLLMSLFVGLIVYSARIPDQYACLQWVNGFGRGTFNMNILDLKSGSTMPDMRSQQTSPFGILSPDGKLRVTMQLGRSGAAVRDLVIQGDGDANNPPTTTLIQPDFSANGNSFDQLRSVRWSPDGKRLAYLWSNENQQTYLSVVNVDGSGKQSAEFRLAEGAQSANAARNTFANPITFRWSADGSYLNVEQITNGPNIESLWSLNPLRRLEGVIPSTLETGVWSPKGNRFAGITDASSSMQSFVIWSPDNVAEIPLDSTGTNSGQIFWSPDGRYVTLQSQQPCSIVENCTQRWSFDIFSSTGTTLVTDLAGVSADGASSSIYSSPTLIASWSSDGESWVFLQPQGRQQDLVSLHVSDGKYTTIASNIVMDLGQDMLFPPRYSRGGGPFFRNANLIRAAASQRIVIPTRQNGKINVDLADVDGQHRVNLVQGADEIIDPSFMQPGNSNHFWMFPGDYVIVAWAKTDANNVRRVNLTWAAVDGSGKHDLDEQIDGISYIQITQINGQRWIGYMAVRGGDYSLEIADLNTGKPLRLLHGLEDSSQWSLIAGPQGAMAAVQLGAYANRFYGETSLYVVGLDGSLVRQISSQAIGPVQWSPGGTKLAYLWQGGSTTVTYAQIVAASGEALQQLPIRQVTSTTTTTSSQQPRLFGWSQCT